jgi:hypothetical protein
MDPTAGTFKAMSPDREVPATLEVKQGNLSN